MTNASEDTATGTAQTVEELFPLWIDDRWYIPVDSEGQCVGICGEGALGFIIQLLSTESEESVRALKIPRLVAETHRENAYISELLSQELNAVRRIFDEPGGAGGLLQALDTSSPLQTPLTIQRLGEAKEWDGSLIFVRFEKGQNPYFCLVKPGKDSTYPPEAKAPTISTKSFAELEAASLMQEFDKKPTGWSQMVFVEQAQGQQYGEAENGDKASPQVQQGKEKRSQENVRIFSVDGALSPEKAAGVTTWYTCVPSVVYAWAPNTLQEAIGLGTRGALWSINDHLRLAENICNGIKVLHDKEMLHADVRPANIVYLGDSIKPASYVLSDYGSFAITNVQPAGRRGFEPSDKTHLGPVIGGERTSTFYAPERRVGRERETADTAIVVNPGETSESYYIIVGWKSEFMELGLLDRRAKPNKAADDYVKFIQDHRNQSSSKSTYVNILYKGDRIQLRDYVFELAATEQVLDKMQVFECDKLYWTIYHGRIVIHENKEFRDPYAFPIPRVIELLQWSAATDLYGLGVLCLYSVYSDFRNDSAYISNLQQKIPYQNDVKADDHSDNPNGITINPQEDKSYQNDVKTGDGGDAPNSLTGNQTKTMIDKVDEGFEAMMTYLADKSLFNAVWPKLEWLRNQIESKLQQEDWTAEKLAEHLFEKNKDLPTDNSDTSDEEDTDGDKPTLKTEAIEVVSQITATVPGIERLLKTLSEKNDTQSYAQDLTPSGRFESPTPKIEYQLGPFIFYIHFVLRCLHRQEDLEAEADWIKDWMMEPFCKNRHDAPGEGAIAGALKRLTEIRDLITKPMLRGLKTEASNISPFDLRSETELRSELRNLNTEKEEWKKEEIKLTEENEKLDKNVENLSYEVSKLTKERDELRPRVQELKRELDAVKVGSEEAIKLLSDVSHKELFINRRKVIEDIRRKFAEALLAPPTDRTARLDEVNNEQDDNRNDQAD